MRRPRDSLLAVALGRWANGPLVGFDIETTGLDRELDEPISYAFATYDGGALVSVDTGYLLPEREIAAGATAVHGLTVERLVELGARSLGEGIAHVVGRVLALSAEQVPVVGCNLAYDLTIIDRMCSRGPVAGSLRGLGWVGPALDVLVIDRAMDRDFEVRPARRLDALCAHYGVAAPTHAADSDARAAVEVLLGQVARFGELAMMSLGALQTAQSEWHASWCIDREVRHRGGQLSLFDVVESWPYVERPLVYAR
jgi:DNA polymerase-3 subunit epsilon